MLATSRLADLVATFKSVLVGYSGGVDSALLAVTARQALGRDRTIAAIGRSASYPADQYARALDIARRFDLDLVEITTGELEDPRYAANPTNRCYFCKQELWRALGQVARERGMAVVVDGTHADDHGEHRPGRAAGIEAGIRSPLAEAGYTKEDIRREARSLGLPVWDAPAAPCLSSRVLYGLSVTPERLGQVEAGEAVLRAAGIHGDLRVRHRGDEARIEVLPGEFPLVRARGVEIGNELLALGFSRVTLDLGGYRRGSLLAGDAAVELLAARD
ncbi:MAG: ATP-dependent sacrificial sulfur transferase LarE [Gemmatimonadetes bacterium]|nr:ATP-dependent sacrificial sulfur transferase LarE [Gemmatimonadota bacterium]